MATILQTYKYFNVFTGHYLKTYRNSYFPFQHVLKIHNEARDVNSEESTAILTEFIDRTISMTPRKSLENIQEKYVSFKKVTYFDLVMFLTSFDSSIRHTSEKVFIEKNIRILIGCCGKILLHEMPNVRAQLTNNLWSLLKSLDLQLNQSHYNILLRVYLENEQDFSPAEILLEMSKKGIDPDDQTYEYLLKYYSRKGNIEEANKILNYLKESGIPVNERFLNALIIGNAKANDMKGALNIFNIMEEMGCPPSSKTYAALLEAYAKKGDIENIMETIRKCKSKDIFLLDNHKMNIIYYLAINGHGKHVDEILHTLAWDQSFINDCINFISKLMYHKQIDVAIQILLSAKKEGLPEYILNSMFRSIGRNIISLDLPEDKIIKSFQLLEKERFHVYEVTLEESFKKRNIKYCIPLFKAWSKIGFEIKEHFFWPIFAMHGLRNPQVIFDTLHTMRNEIGITPSFDTLTRFVLPYVITANYNEFANLLIKDFGIPAESAINAVLFHNLSKNKMDSAVKIVKNCETTNIHFDGKMLLPVLHDAFSNTGNEDDYEFLKNMFEKKSRIKERSNIPINFLPPILEKSDQEFKLLNCIRKEDLNGAKNCIRKLMNSQWGHLSTKTLLCYFDLLVKNDRLSDALQVIEYFSSRFLHISYNLDTIEQWKSSMNLLVDKGSVEGVNQIFDIIKKKNLKLAMRLSNSLVQVHLVRNESKQALDVVNKIYNRYYFIPAWSELMKAFITTEEVQSLQWFTDFGIQRKGERSTLMTLAVAFLQCQHLRQSRRILKSLRLPIRDDSLKIRINKLLTYEEISVVKDLLQVSKGLNAINRNVLYEMLLEKYSVMNNWEEGLALWKIMLEDGDSPSEIFLVILSELLKRNGQTPLELKSISNVKVQDDFYAKVTRMYIKNNSYPCQDFMNVLVKNLVDAGDIKTLELIENNWLNLNKVNPSNTNFKFEVCTKTNQVDSYLEQLKTKIDFSHRIEFLKYIKNIEKPWINYLLKHPENVKSFETLAMQIHSRHNYSKPIVVVLSYYFLKDVPRAKELLTQMPELHTNQSYKLIIELFVICGFFEQLPLLAEVFHQFSNFPNKVFYEEFLHAYEENNKYEEGFQVLVRINAQKQNKMNFEEEEKQRNPELMKSQLTL